MLAKGNRSAAVTAACKKHGGFYLGSIGGPAARLAQDCIKKVEVLEYPELGMEAVWKIEVVDFPAFIVVDDKGNDFFADIGTRRAGKSAPRRPPTRVRARRVTARPSQANLLIVFYADPDRYPPTYSAACLLAQHFRVRLMCRRLRRSAVDGVAGRTCASIASAHAAPPPSRTPRRPRRRPRSTSASCGRCGPRSRPSAPAIVYAYEPHALVALRLGGCRAPIVYQRHDPEELGPIDRRSLQGWVNLWARRLGRSADVVVMPEKQRLIGYQRFVGDGRPGMVIPNFPLRTSFPAPDDWGGSSRSAPAAWR